MKSKAMAIVRALEDFKVALPEKNLIVKKEDVLTMDIFIAYLLAKERKVEILYIKEIKGAGINELGENREVDMAKVEGK